jgi:hypothetical protein
MSNPSTCIEILRCIESSIKHFLKKVKNPRFHRKFKLLLGHLIVPSLGNVNHMVASRISS